ncbi:hypothetical protein [Candidatus Colwellia aromaticivorans]|uniref:hypothetical protein n=1 Tax=Candidatus Colwellia aromaticivorans TaxID=2267621 RepID=UPI001FE33555|nr:hypothetical protein [Candidatus Colwellia aromaticivorans]
MIKRIIISLLLISFLLIASSITWLYSKVDNALPLLNGEETILGLQSTAVIDRDS